MQGYWKKKVEEIHQICTCAYELYVISVPIGLATRVNPTIYVKSLCTTVSLHSSTFQCDKYLYYGRFGNYSQLSLIWDQARSCSFSRLKMTLIQRQLVIFENDQKNGLGFYLKNMALTDPSLLVYCS